MDTPNVVCMRDFYDSGCSATKTNVKGALISLCDSHYVLCKVVPSTTSMNNYLYTWYHLDRVCDRDMTSSIGSVVPELAVLYGGTVLYN